MNDRIVVGENQFRETNSIGTLTNLATSYTTGPSIHIRISYRYFHSDLLNEQKIHFFILRRTPLTADWRLTPL
jgi:hypothetical protein